MEDSFWQPYKFAYYLEYKRSSHGIDPVMQYSVEIGDRAMKALKVNLVGALVWVIAALTVVACSDKGKNGAPNTQACQGQIVNGVCTWDPNNLPAGGSVPGGYAFNPNGDITNNSKFRDFNIRFFMDSSYAYCGYSYPYGCDDIQVKLQKINETEYYIYLTSTSLGSYYNVGKVATTIRLNATKFTYSNQSQVVFEVWYNNPVRYVIAELELPQGLTNTNAPYFLNYKDNTYPVNIATGTLRKGYDFY